MNIQAAILNRSVWFVGLSVLVLFICCGSASSQRAVRTSISVDTLLRIVRAEDTRRWDSDLQTLLTDKDARVRQRAALAVGRIGDEKSVPALISLLQNDSETSVRSIAAFALGEIESATAADALIAVLKETQKEPPQIRARAVEALGKIAAAVPKADEAKALPMRQAILATLFEGGARSDPDEEVMLLALTAALRARPEKAGPALAKFVSFSNPDIRATAENTLARLKLNDANPELPKLLVNDPDPIVRANAARVLGATEDKAAFDSLLDRAINDTDLRVRVSAIRALATLQDKRAATSLLDRGRALLQQMPKASTSEEGLPPTVNELIELAVTIGRLLQGSNDVQAVEWLEALRARIDFAALEVEIAFARVASQAYGTAARKGMVSYPFHTSQALTKRPKHAFIPEQEIDPAQLIVVPKYWRSWSSVAQGLRELASVKSNAPMVDASVKIEAVRMLQGALECPLDRPTPRPITKVAPGSVLTRVCTPIPLNAIPDFLRAYAAFKQPDTADILKPFMTQKDVIIRATAAELLGELLPDEKNTEQLVRALPKALSDNDLNDAAIAILDSLGKQKSPTANDAIKTALESKDIQVRRKAVELLKANGAGDFSAQIGSVETRNSTADYQRALSRIGKQVRATVATSKGSFVIEFNPEEAPLTVDNFVMLARKGYFNGQTVPRVVPNFVIQTGDPRGDQSGGPGYAIRCEINELPYKRGAVGMALSGKDTGGSQWFVTHSPQPHLDGGYTVFGTVVSGMDVVDRIVRGDTVLSISISEIPSRSPLVATRPPTRAPNGKPH